MLSGKGIGGFAVFVAGADGVAGLGAEASGELVDVRAWGSAVGGLGQGASLEVPQFYRGRGDFVFVGTEVEEAYERIVDRKDRITACSGGGFCVEAAALRAFDVADGVDGVRVEKLSGRARLGRGPRSLRFRDSGAGLDLSRSINVFSRTCHPTDGCCGSRESRRRVLMRMHDVKPFAAAIAEASVCPDVGTLLAVCSSPLADT